MKIKQLDADGNATIVDLDKVEEEPVEEPVVEVNPLEGKKIKFKVINPVAPYKIDRTYVEDWSLFLQMIIDMKKIVVLEVK